MGDPLRDRQSPAGLAANRQVIEINEEILSFGRLVEHVEADLSALDPADVPADWRESVVTGRLQFGFGGAADAVPVLEGRLEAGVAAVCQRCLAAFEWPLETELRLQLCGSADTPGDHEGYELWELAGTEVSPLEIVDEALVMAMPLSAKHENCIEVDAADVHEEMITPFASLRAQMDEEK